MIVPITREGKLVLVKQFKPGIGEILIQFPVGRIEKNHESFLETAQHELEEETGIHAEKSQLHDLGKLHAFSTKATERVYLFVAENCEFNSQQSLDENEDIEVLEVSFAEFEEMIASGEFWDAEGIAAWHLVGKKFPLVSY